MKSVGSVEIDRPIDQVFRLTNDHHADPMEFNNLAIKPDSTASAAMARLRPLLRQRASGITPTTPFNPERL